jgi:hypothetical protein
MRIPTREGATRLSCLDETNEAVTVRRPLSYLVTISACRGRCAKRYVLDGQLLNWLVEITGSGG